MRDGECGTRKSVSGLYKGQQNIMSSIERERVCVRCDDDHNNDDDDVVVVVNLMM